MYGIIKNQIYSSLFRKPIPKLISQIRAAHGLIDNHAPEQKGRIYLQKRHLYKHLYTFETKDSHIERFHKGRPREFLYVIIICARAFGSITAYNKLNFVTQLSCVHLVYTFYATLFN